MTGRRSQDTHKSEVLGNAPWKAWRARAGTGGGVAEAVEGLRVQPSPRHPLLWWGMNSTVFGKYLFDQHPEPHDA
jgi:hypothetical protein